jgi:hypothetical protein
MFSADKVNPVLLRELRRLARNGFAITVVSLFLVALFVCAVLLLGEAVRNNGRAEAACCYVGFVLLGASVMVGAIPFLVFLRHAAQSRLDRDDLIFLTGLKPRQIVDGMALSGFIGALLLLSVTLPVLMLGLLVAAADLVYILVFAALLALLSACANYAAVACASMRESTAIRRLSLGLTAVPFAVAILLLSIVGGESDASPLFIDDDFLLAVSYMVACVVAGGLVARSVAIGELAPESSNRHFGFHVSIPIAWAILTGAEFGFIMWVNDDWIGVFEYMKIVALCAMMLVAACSAPLRSAAVWRRMKEDRPWRGLRHVFYSGGERGMAICLALTGLSLGLSEVLLSLRSYYSTHYDYLRRDLAGLWHFAGFALLPIILARLVWRLAFFRRVRHPAKTVLCATIAFGMALIFLSIASGPGGTNDALASGIFPFVIDSILFMPLFFDASTHAPK